MNDKRYVDDLERSISASLLKKVYVAQSDAYIVLPNKVAMNKGSQIHSYFLGDEQPEQGDDKMVEAVKVFNKKYEKRCKVEERTFFYHEDYKCTAKIDFWLNHHIYDLKTTKQRMTDNLASSLCDKFHYDLQLAFYDLYALSVPKLNHNRRQNRLRIVFFEKETYKFFEYVLTLQDRQRGRAKVDKAMETMTKYKLLFNDVAFNNALDLRDEIKRRRAIELEHAML